MPKIIENLRERLLAEARRAVAEEGYGALTMRKIAAACGVGVGTVYNYFPSKDMLIAGFMVEDWQAMTQKMQSAAEGADARSVLSVEYDGLRRFCEQHRALFSDPEAIRRFSSLPRDRHRMLREQLAAPIERALRQANLPDAAFRATFLAEALLTWTQEGVEKERLLAALEPLLREEKEA